VEKTDTVSSNNPFMAMLAALEEAETQTNPFVAESLVKKSIRSPAVTRRGGLSFLHCSFSSPATKGASRAVRAR
jgi:hypothetical protein